MTKSARKKLNCEFIRINTSRENCDTDYEASRIQKSLSVRLKTKKIKIK